MFTDGGLRLKGLREDASLEKPNIDIGLLLSAHRRFFTKIRMFFVVDAEGGAGTVRSVPYPSVKCTAYQGKLEQAGAVSTAGL
ncbi:hypothetical protein GAO09_01305 [Rhizobiales bacterium RZME27]|uniref:Uncharacterized protein n=1 Tax=Endobacterium cereale TaxID=2663029 RepID=A0A6A8A563_9HYPH|nr:hypothetical protein [Endobacterium cereale]MEB2844793.1 hypothetical protein [Endobacterium cereale]MQY44710.1 hypothetical protein [Endobacterium cereale]